MLSILNKNLIVIIVVFIFFNFEVNSKITFIATYKKDRDCIVLLSVAKDRYINSGHKITYNKLTKLQNDFFLKYPEGHFSTKNIDNVKSLYKKKIKENGIFYLNKELIKCGFK